MRWIVLTIILSISTLAMINLTQSSNWYWLFAAIAILSTLVILAIPTTNERSRYDK